VSARPEEAAGGWSQAALAEPEFRRLAEFVQGHCGIQMPPSKRIMAESRLRKRLRALGLTSFRDYCAHVFGSQGVEERVMLLDAMSTNKTDFFREPQHFEILVRRVLPELLRRGGAGVQRPLRVWSAGCSSGEEPYTLAMVLGEVAEGMPGFRYQILGTDISVNVLQTARRAIYPEERIAPVPAALRRKYLLRSRDRGQSLVRIVPELRGLVSFRRLNFMEGEFGLRETMDVIFFRNVMIYFDRPTQETLLNRFCRHLTPGGHLFLGHSETINGLRVPVSPVAPTVYRYDG